MIYARHLANAIELVDRHPEQPFVVDHIAKPTISSLRFDDDWAARIQMLARREHVVCKLSGLPTEVQTLERDIELLRPYFYTVLEAFGPGRLMFGSDWPVCLLATEYSEWVATVQNLIAELSTAEQAQIMGLTASRVYGLETP